MKPMGLRDSRWPVHRGTATKHVRPKLDDSRKKLTRIGTDPNGPLAALPSGFLWMVVAGLICALIATAAGLSRGLRRRRGVPRIVSTVKPRTGKSEPTRPALEEPSADTIDESVTGEQADEEIDELFRSLDKMEASTARAGDGIEAEDSPVAARSKKR